MKKLLILLLLSACVCKPLEKGCSLYVDRHTNGFETITSYGKTCIQKDGSISTHVDYIEHKNNIPNILIPKPPYKR